MSDKLTAKEEAFCQAYIATGTQMDAYKSAYKWEHMKYETIAVTAHKLTKIPKIGSRILALKAEIEKRNAITIDELITDLANMVRFDPADMYDPEGRLKGIHEMPKPVRQMITSLDVQELFIMDKGHKMNIGEVKKVKLYNKLDAIEKLLKHLGGYEKDNFQKKVEQQVVVFQLPDNNREVFIPESE